MLIKKLDNFIYRKLWVVLFVSIIFSGLVTMGVLILNPIKFQSSTSLYIANKSINNSSEITYSDMLASKSLVDNYEQIVKSDMFAENIIKKLLLTGISPNLISSQISSSTLRNSNILEIKVKQTNKVLAQKIAEIIPDVLSELQLLKSDTELITVLNRPYEAKPIIWGIILVSVAAFIGGMILAFITLFIFKPNSYIIRTPEDVEKTLGLVVTGTIPDFTF